MMLFPSRAFNWISSTDPASDQAINSLAEAMCRFYSENQDYYGSIDYASSAWTEDPVYRDIAARLKNASRILELGCGAARILDHYPELASRYTGLDFSEQLLKRNRERHRTAKFASLTRDGRPPSGLGQFDAVFSVFVLEHCVRPRQFLDDSLSLTKPGGTWILRCPHFLGVNRVPSQRLGFAAGTGREKLARGHVFDALVTGWDNRVRMPLMCRYLRQQSKRNCAGSGFYVNLAPTCAVDPFLPDRDAVYLTYELEIVRHLETKVSLEGVDGIVQRDAEIYLVGRRRAHEVDARCAGDSS